MEHGGAAARRRRDCCRRSAGTAGPSKRTSTRWSARFARARLPSLQPGTWKLWGVRPENAPARRVAAAAALLRAAGDARTRCSASLDASTVNEAIAPLLISASGYWLTPPRRLRGALPAAAGARRALARAGDHRQRRAARGLRVRRRRAGQRRRARCSRGCRGRRSTARRGSSRRRWRRRGSACRSTRAARRGCWRCSATGARRTAAGGAG